MLTAPYHQAFVALHQAIDRLSQLVDEKNLTPAAVEAAQQVFQTQILPLDSDNLDAPIAAKLQSIQTEIAKQFRLLSTDVVFLQAARQSATAAQRQGQIHDRLKLLRQYCDGVLGGGGEEMGG